MPSPLLAVQIGSASDDLVAVFGENVKEVFALLTKAGSVVYPTPLLLSVHPHPSPSSEGAPPSAVALHPEAQINYA